MTIFRFIDRVRVVRFKRESGERGATSKKKKAWTRRGRVRYPKLKFPIEISLREAVDPIIVESPANCASSIDCVHVRELLALGTVDRARRYPNIYRPCLSRLPLSSLRTSLGNQLNPAFSDYAISHLEEASLANGTGLHGVKIARAGADIRALTQGYFPRF